MHKEITDGELDFYAGQMPIMVTVGALQYAGWE